MKPDVLERLLMDNALGRLEPDVEAMLADYLANDATAAAQAGELQDLVHAATEAVRQPAPVIEMPNRIHRLVWRHRAERMLALAASFVVGAGLAAMVIHMNLHPGNVVAASTHAPAVPVSQPALVKNNIDSLPFWSNQRAYRLASANAKEIVK